MKNISLNVRGLGGVTKRRSIWECISKYNPTSLILQETKKENITLQLMKSSMGPKLTEWYALPACGTSRGILIAWDVFEIKKVNEIVGNFSVPIKVNEVSFGFEWMISGVLVGPTLFRFFG